MSFNVLWCCLRFSLTHNGLRLILFVVSHCGPLTRWLDTVSGSLLLSPFVDVFKTIGVPVNFFCHPLWTVNQIIRCCVRFYLCCLPLWTFNQIIGYCVRHYFCCLPLWTVIQMIGCCVRLTFVVSLCGPLTRWLDTVSGFTFVVSLCGPLTRWLDTLSGLTFVTPCDSHILRPDRSPGPVHATIRFTY